MITNRRNRRTLVLDPWTYPDPRAMESWQEYGRQRFFRYERFFLLIHSVAHAICNMSFQVFKSYSACYRISHDLILTTKYQLETLVPTSTPII